jgi:ABC-2 type transport system ATP-binding protein
MAREAVLSISGVKKSYGRIQALKGVDLTVYAGEVVALLGPNGAGKSTLLQILTGLFSPDEGSVEVLGHDLRRNAIVALSGIGVVFQQPTLDLELTVVHNLLFHTDLHGLDRKTARERIRLALERFGLTERQKERVRVLSGGNRRRVELARSLLHEPRVLFMDEPTAGLDPASRRDLLEDIRRLRSERQLGVLWTTHLIDEAESADRIVVLHRGLVLFDGTREEMMAVAKRGSVREAFLALTGMEAVGGEETVNVHEAAEASA